MQPLRQALVLSLGPAVGVGLGRFAYALILPAMRADLGWSYTQAGGLNTANGIGYLLGALAAAPLCTRLGLRRTFLAAMAATAIGLLLSGLTAVYELILLLRLLVGLAGAVVFVAGGSLAAEAASQAPRRVGLVLGAYYGGVGAGIALSGVLVPPLLDQGGAGAWRTAWFGLGGLGLLALAAAWGRVAAPRAEPTGVVRPSGRDRANWRTLAPAFAAYGLFGLGYVSYMAFVVAYLRSHGEGTLAVALFWAALGIAAIASGPLWSRVVGRQRGGRAIAATMAVVTAGALLPLWSSAYLAMLVSALLFGGSFLTVVTAVTALVRRSLRPERWAAGLGAFTVAFAAGQCLGPLVSGALADTPAGLAAGLVLSGGVLALGGLAALAQPDRPAPGA